MSYQHPKYKMLRWVALWLHDEKCHICKRANLAIECHHIDKDKQNHSLLNLVPLCFQCHKLVHKASTKIHYNRQKVVVLLLRKVEFFSKPKDY